MRPSVEHRPRDMSPPRTVRRKPAAVPEPVVERPWRDARAAGECLAGVDGAGADLALELAAGRKLAAAVDRRGQLLAVDQTLVEPQDVRDEVVGEDRQAVDVGEVGDAR